MKKYHESISIKFVREQFRLNFPGRNPPAKSTIQHNVQKHARDGTTLYVNKGRSGRSRTVRTPQNIGMVRQARNMKAKYTWVKKVILLPNYKTRITMASVQDSNFARIEGS